MKKTQIAAVTLTLLAAPAVASARDASVARLVGISGNVLVSNDFNIASAGEKLRLVPGARVLVTANSSAVVEYDAGCRVTLNAGERFQVRAERPCGGRSSQAGSAFAGVIGSRP